MGTSISKGGTDANLTNMSQDIETVAKRAVKPAACKKNSVVFTQEQNKTLGDKYLNYLTCQNKGGSGKAATFEGLVCSKLNPNKYNYEGGDNGGGGTDNKQVWTSPKLVVKCK